jgi:integrase
MLVKAMRGFFSWALEAGRVSINPTERVKIVEVATDGFEPWTAADLKAYRARCPLGTRQRVAFEVLLQTGLRRGDAVSVGPAHVEGAVIRIATEKTGERVAIAMTPELAAAISAGPIGETFIVGAGGKPMVKEAFGNVFRTWTNEAGVKKSAHGLRKAAATADAMDGYSEFELSSKFGWSGTKMASLYTRSANRERLSLAATERVEM